MTYTDDDGNKYRAVRSQDGKVAEYIYEATRVEAEWSKRPIVPELWKNRDDKFRKQFVDIIAKYMSMDKLPTPAEAHESWNQSYYKMGWKYGEVRNVEAKTHPDLLPFDELSQPERDKDAIFLAFVWLATQLNELTNAYTTNKINEARIEELENSLKTTRRALDVHYEGDYHELRKAVLDPQFDRLAELKEALNHRKDKDE